MIRFDIQKCDFPKIREFVFAKDDKTLLSHFSLDIDQPAKVEILIDDNGEGEAFGELLVEKKIPILKKRVF